MESKDYLTGQILERSIPLASRAVSAALTVGEVKNIVGVEEIKIILSASAHTSGTVAIQDVQFADDNNFTTNVTTFTSDDYLRKNNRNSSVSAIAQTVLGAVGGTQLSLANLALGSQKFFRVRVIQNVGISNLTFEVQTTFSYGDKTQIQS